MIHGSNSDNSEPITVTAVFPVELLFCPTKKFHSICFKEYYKDYIQGDIILYSQDNKQYRYNF